MLVLTRKKDQTLIIGEDVEVTILEIQGDQIRIGVNAPSNIKIYRKELFAEIQAENKAAARQTTAAAAENLKNLLKLSGNASAGSLPKPAAKADAPGAGTGTSAAATATAAEGADAPVATAQGAVAPGTGTEAPGT